MPSLNQQAVPTIQNHFQAGFKTEFTGLNFPENAATAASNCVFTLTGDVNRRGGLNYEANSHLVNINAPSVALSSFRWLNAGGDGQSQILVEQIGTTIYFYLSSNATVALPLSTTKLTSTVNLSVFQSQGNTANIALTECQYSSGNGYLFVFHPNCDPFYCTYINGVVTAFIITLQIRDFIGVPDGLAITARPTVLSPEHQYNLQNQGWSSGPGWTATTTLQTQLWPTVGATFTVGLASVSTPASAITIGSVIGFSGNGVPPLGGNVLTSCTGTVTAYNSASPTSVTITVASCTNPGFSMGTYSGGTFFPGTVLTGVSLSAGFISTWFSAFNNYPSDADVWWLYVDPSDTPPNKFDPAVMAPNIQPAQNQAPQGHVILNPFVQQRSNASGISGITDIITTSRPGTGAFFSGRVFYAGVNSSQAPTGDQPYYTWTENIYFSKIIETQADFPLCYQQNDPTSQDLFELLPSDGGVINIPGTGAIYKLFPLRFGLLVFAANGIWFIGGSTGVGFSANDYTITKISSIQCISGTSFIEVQGYPFFWNSEGIYQVTPSSQPGSAHSPDIQLDVQNLTVGTILTYYQNFPQQSIKFAKGDYDQLNYVVQWLVRSTNESGISNRYTYDTIVSYNVVTKAFYPYNLPTTSASIISDIKYIQSPGGSTSPLPILKYLTQQGGNITFSEENDFTLYVDFFSENNVGYNFTSSFIAGYQLQGQGLRRFQTPYIYIFSRNPSNNGYIVQGIWDYAGDGNSGRFSTRQIITNSATDFSAFFRRIRVRGRGLAFQLSITSQPGLPFDLMGWSILNEVNVGV